MKFLNINYNLRMSFILSYAIEQVRTRYSRSIFGFAWVSFQFALLIGVKLKIFGFINQNDDFALFMIIGLTIWMYINASILDGAISLISATNWLLNFKVEPLVFILSANIQSFITLILYLLPACIFLSAIPTEFTVIGFLYVAMGFFANLVIMIILGIILAPLCTAFRDIYHLINGILRVLFFATPIIWFPTPGTVLETIAFWNPFSHLIELIRTPLLSNEFPLQSWMVTLSLTIILGTLTVFVYLKTRKSIQVWL